MKIFLPAATSVDIQATGNPATVEITNQATGNLRVTIPITLTANSAGQATVLLRPGTHDQGFVWYGTDLHSSDRSPPLPPLVARINFHRADELVHSRHSIPTTATFVRAGEVDPRHRHVQFHPHPADRPVHRQAGRSGTDGGPPARRGRRTGRRRSTPTGPATSLCWAHSRPPPRRRDRHGRGPPRAARGLLALGVRKGDRVGIWAPNRFEWVVTQFATARVGAILVTINPAYHAEELQYALTKAGVSLLVMACGFRDAD